MTLDSRLGTEIIYDFYGSSSVINITVRLQSPCGCGERAWWYRCAVGSVNHGGSSMIGRSLVVGRWGLGRVWLSVM